LSAPIVTSNSPASEFSKTIFGITVSYTSTFKRLLKMRSTVNNYKCPLCEMTCPTPSGLRHHIKYRHTNERSFKCSQCDYRCGKDEKDNQISNVFVTFSAKRLWDMRLHMAKHGGKELKCAEPDCNFECKLEQTLRSHYHTAHGV
jgi:hypothetical protein